MGRRGPLPPAAGGIVFALSFGCAAPATIVQPPPAAPAPAAPAPAAPAPPADAPALRLGRCAPANARLIDPELEFFDIDEQAGGDDDEHAAIEGVIALLNCDALNIRRCFADAFAQFTPKDPVQILEITINGSEANASLFWPSDELVPLERCLKDIVSRWSFEGASGTTIYRATLLVGWGEPSMLIPPAIRLEPRRHRL